MRVANAHLKPALYLRRPRGAGDNRAYDMLFGVLSPRRGERTQSYALQSDPCVSPESLLAEPAGRGPFSRLNPLAEPAGCGHRGQRYHRFLFCIPQPWPARIPSRQIQIWR